MELITASAGSGKTYTLAKKYIEILLDAYVRRGGDCTEFEHILAVTFTNKATAEMKERILHELYILAKNPSDSSYYADFSAVYTEKTVSEKKMWKRILLCILHNYSRFSVSTIDTFFQSVLRNFARELGSYDSYRISLERDALINETADNLLSSIEGVDDPVYKIISDLTKSRFEEGRKCKVRIETMEIARNLMGGEFLRSLDTLFNHGHETLREDFYRELREHTDVFEKRVDAVKVFIERQLRELYSNVASASKTIYEFLDDYPGQVNSKLLNAVRNCYEKKGRCGCLSPSYAEALKNGKVFNAKFAQLNERFAPLVPLAESMLNDLLNAGYLKDIYQSIPQLRFAVRVFKEFDALTDRENVKCLDETTQLLSDIINGSDVPFIYEKIGVQFVHYLLDEFQDTSHVQWSNFKPLLENAESMMGKNLVVGDAKQSIYRFRNSDHTILTQEVPCRFPKNHGAKLDTNFRSGRKIVEFNNGLFAFLAKELDGLLQSDDLKKIYLSQDSNGAFRDSLEQKTSKGFDGCVSYVKVDGAVAGEVSENMTQEVLTIVETLKGKGVKPKDILVLVKGKEDGGKIAQILLNHGHGVYSDDSLLVDSNPLARKLLALLRYMDNPRDEISKALAEEFGEISYSTLVDLCEQAIGRIKEKYSLTEEGLAEFNGSIPYFSSLVDLASDYQINYGNSLHGFLSYYGRKERQIASSSSEESVRIMTIHKSKGLAGEFVIVPFVQKILLWDPIHNAKWSEINDDILQDKFAEVHDFVYYARLKQDGTKFFSPFSNAYNEERKAEFIDALNLLYVAFTRPVHALFIVDGENSRGEYISEHIARYFETNDIPKISGDLDKTVEDYLSCGKPGGDVCRKITARYDVYDCSASICNSFEAVDFFSAGVVSQSIKGIFCHEILSLVHTLDDVPCAVAQKWQEGVLNLNESQAVEYFSNKIASVASYGWFSAQALVSVEVELLVRIGSKIETRRPDRVVIHPSGRVDIVDYKFGEEHSGKYHEQVAQYCDYYRRLGYADVSGYIWYVPENKVEKV